MKFLLSTSPATQSKTVGIYARGGCDMPALFASAPLIRQAFEANFCLIHDGSIADSRSDVLLQTVREIPDHVTEPIAGNLRLPPDYFKPHLFEPTFRVPAQGREEEITKNVIIMSIGPDTVRTAYRHRQHDLLVDPGGIWLGRPMEDTLGDLSTARWFKENFVSAGRIGTDESMTNLGRIIRLLRQNGDPHILVLNVLGPEPRSSVHSYQFVKDPLPIRRRELSLALVQLSRELDFSIVDINRVLQQNGISDHIDWGHPHPRQYVAIAQELFHIMSDRGVFSGCSPRELRRKSHAL